MNNATKQYTITSIKQNIDDYLIKLVHKGVESEIVSSSFGITPINYNENGDALYNQRNWIKIISGSVFQ
jgi:hypothetical protein